MRPPAPEARSLRKVGALGPFASRADAEGAALQTARSHDLPSDKALCHNAELQYWWGRDHHDPLLIHVYLIEEAPAHGQEGS